MLAFTLAREIFFPAFAVFAVSLPKVPTTVSRNPESLYRRPVHEFMKIFFSARHITS